MAFSSLSLAIIASVIMTLPVTISHMFAEDAGLGIIGGGKITPAEVAAYPPLIFHVLFILGATQLVAFAFAIYFSIVGNGSQKKAVAGIFLVYVGLTCAGQYLKPWNSDPISPTEMPFPLLYTWAVLTVLGAAFDKDISGKKAKGKKAKKSS